MVYMTFTVTRFGCFFTLREKCNQHCVFVVYSQSGVVLRLLELCLSLEVTRADSDFPSFNVKEFFLWDS